ncbi:MAG: acyl-CoA dehydrogenase family protein [Alphaproteobacteria bacterium]|nr:acyl-CoA dehydrogenase family protein [Alphaproteobacteria bacterium]
MSDRSFLSWPFLEERHALLHDRVEAWAKAHASMMHGEDDTGATAGRVVRRLVAEMGKEGLLATATGGRDGALTGALDARSLCICREVLARYSGLADFAFAMQGLGTGAISLFGTDEQKARYLPAVARGEVLAAFALSEQAAGSDVSALAMTATKDGDGWRLDGEKTWISNAGIADLYVVFARTGEAPGARGLSAFIVEASAPGFAVSQTIDLIAPHPIGKLALDGVRVTRRDMIAEGGRGFAVAMGTLDVFRTTVGAAALGFARRAMDEAVSHALRRKLFGGTLSDLQLTKAKIADMAVAIDAAALLVYRSAWTKDVKGARVSRESAMAKLVATEEAQTVIDSAVQIFGGLGVTRGNIAETLYREIRALRIYEGATEVQKVVIAGRVLADAAS